MVGQWDTELSPAGCPGLAGLLVSVHMGVAIVPWAAGCWPMLAVVLSAVSLAALPQALRAVPGCRAAIRCLRTSGAVWTATLADGSECAAVPVPGSRVLERFVFCRLRLDGGTVDWWLPAYAVPAAEFRRFKVALRCRQEAAQAALLDSGSDNPEEAARRGTGSRRAN